MPELPEVETTRLGILPHIVNKRVDEVIIRDGRLRWPVPPSIRQKLPGQTIHDVTRRAKYLVFQADTGRLIMHLGMSGSLRMVDAASKPLVHDHVELRFSHKRALRFHDPRRFGCVLWTTRPERHHKLFRELGPEPLEDDFNGAYLYRKSRGRRLAIKNFIMNSHVVVGVGNIYASESLFMAGIHPLRAAGRISKQRYDQLADSIRKVLMDALASGGSTLRDFIAPDGNSGYFQHHFRVYDRAGSPCEKCGQPVRQVMIGQRASYYCASCQR